MTPIKSRKHCFQQTLAKLMGKPDRNDGLISWTRRHEIHVIYSFPTKYTITELLKHTTISVVQFRFFVREFRIIVFSCLRVHYSEDGAYPPVFPKISADTPCSTDDEFLKIFKLSQPPSTFAGPGHVLLPAKATPNTRILVAVLVGGLPTAMCAKLVAANLELVQRLGIHTNRALSISRGRHRTHLVLCGDCAACAARSVVHAEAPFWTRSAANCTQFQGASSAPTGWTYSTYREGVLSMAAHARFVLDLVVVRFWVRGWVDIITFAMALLKAIA